MSNRRERFTKLVDKHALDRRINNFESFYQEIKNKTVSTLPENIQIKIQNECNKNAFLGLTEELVLNKIKRDRVYGVNFIVDAFKQNIAEDTTYQYLKRSFRNNRLVTSRDKRRYVINGSVYNEEQYRKGLKLNKKRYTSIDFGINYQDRNIIISAKYIRESGGAQDRQLDNLVSFFTEANSNKNKKNIFVILCDGKYFTDKKISYLKNLYPNNKRLIVSDTLSLKQDIDNLINSGAI